MHTSGAPGGTIHAGTTTRNSRRVGARSMEIPWNSPSEVEARELHVQVRVDVLGVDVGHGVGSGLVRLADILELHGVVIWSGGCRSNSPRVYPSML